MKRNAESYLEGAKMVQTKTGHSERRICWRGQKSSPICRRVKKCHTGKRALSEKGREMCWGRNKVECTLHRCLKPVKVPHIRQESCENISALEKRCGKEGVECKIAKLFETCQTGANINREKKV